MTSEHIPTTTAVAVVAEDELVILMDLAENLRDLGFAVVETTDAAGALSALAEHDNVGLLVTDVHMPGAMNGFALAREVSARWPGMKVVVCSAYVRPKPSQMPEGARFLDKPYSARLLADLLSDMGALAS